MSQTQETAVFVAPEIAELAPLFPGYDFEYLIATGGMGAVYRAVQRSLERTVAIKILPREFSQDAAFCAGFEAEAKAMARLNHPNLLGVYDFGEVNGMLYIIMEYVAGQSLFHSAHGQAIDPSEVVRLITGICNGLAHAHQHGILHRDIKPGNILLDHQAEPKIGDFGLARPIERKIEEGEEIFGTPHYTAPEVVYSPHSIDWRTDIFSVGVMLHELLTGKLPADDPRPASAIIHCDPRFDAVVRRATAESPHERYANALELAADLQKIATTAGPRVLRTATPAAAARRAPKRPARTYVAQKKSSSAPMIFVLLLAVGAVAFVFMKASQKVQAAKEQAAAAAAKPKVVHIPAPKKELPKPTPVIEQPVVTEIAPAPSEPEHIVEDTSPTHDFEPEIEPKFDVPGFFDRAHNVMSERAKPTLSTHQTALATNLRAFEESIQPQLRKIPSPGARSRAEKQLTSQMQTWRDQGYRLSDPNSTSFDIIPDFDILLREHLVKQDEIDENIAEKLKQLNPTYILGLQKQIERLEPTDDPGAIKLIQKEIEQTRADPDYFPSLLLSK